MTIPNTYQDIIPAKLQTVVNKGWVFLGYGLPTHLEIIHVEGIN